MSSGAMKCYRVLIRAGVNLVNPIVAGRDRVTATKRAQKVAASMFRVDAVVEDVKFMHQTHATHHGPVA